MPCPLPQMMQIHRPLFVAGMAMVLGFFGCQDPKFDSKSNLETQTGTASQTHDRESGRTQASHAVATGTLLLQEYPPLPSPPAHNEYVELLRTRCGVDYRVPRLPAGTDTRDFIAYIRGWNEVMEAEIRKKFGPNILGDLRQEAKQNWESKLQSAKTSK